MLQRLSGSSIAFETTGFRPRLNCGGHLDIASGSFVPGVDGYVLNGGLNHAFGQSGREQTFKSTELLTSAVNSWVRYPGSLLVVRDTEDAQEEYRLRQFADQPIPEENQMLIVGNAEYTLEEFYSHILALAEERIKHRKDYEVETPIIDPKTGKPFIMLRPAIVANDSWSKERVGAVEESLQHEVKVDSDGEVSAKVQITDGANNAYGMHLANAKNKVITEYLRLASKAGMYMLFSAHIGQKIEVGQRLPSPKQLQHMKQNEKLTNVGSQFTYLVSTLFENRGASVLQDDNRKILYPTKMGMVNDGDLNLVTQVIDRNKGGPSGPTLRSVVSQAFGRQDHLSQYHTLKEEKYWGMSGSPVRHQMNLYPDVTMMRTTVYDQVRTDAKLRRALELTYHLWFVQTYWSFRDLPVPFNMSPQDLFEKLTKTSFGMDEILLSRGWWTYQKDHPQQYLSLYDILAIAGDVYTPRWLQARTVAPKTDPKKKAA